MEIQNSITSIQVKTRNSKIFHNHKTIFIICGEYFKAISSYTGSMKIWLFIFSTMSLGYWKVIPKYDVKTLLLFLDKFWLVLQVFFFFFFPSLLSWVISFSWDYLQEYSSCVEILNLLMLYNLFFWFKTQSSPNSSMKVNPENPRDYVFFNWIETT